ncbi:MAG: M13 family metallopeptidase [Betaproteobacteria bacterium]|nr:MAG: M13 family metallopeptidase [Betaproteobacteria bacterium]
MRLPSISHLRFAAMALSFVSAAVIAQALASGIDVRQFDASVRAQDDFFTYVNGKWLAATPIPPDKSKWGADYELTESIQPQLRELIEPIALERSAPHSEEQKIGDLYAGFMDEARLEDLGLKALEAELAGVAALAGKDAIPALIAHFQQIRVNAPYALYIDQDERNSNAYIAHLSQAGLGLPDRDYYLKDGDARLKSIRRQYLAHVEKMLALAGDRSAAKNARDILALETDLARAQWTKVQNRDPIKTYNKVEFVRLKTLAAAYDWPSYLAAAKLEGKDNACIVSQPSYIRGFASALNKTPLSVWKSYFKWHLLSAHARFLDSRFVAEDFAFNGTVLRDTPENELRWKRGVKLVEESMDEALGKLYVARYFPAESKGRVTALVRNLLAAYAQSIETLDWMDSATKTEARIKLAKVTIKIGYPDRWRDYSRLDIVHGDLIGNVLRANRFEYERNIAKLGKPIDRSEWFMTPQTVNAYYNAGMNEIVFPAAYLQPPFFIPNADDAINYGDVGATIGHEISHAFDDEGSQFDGDGNLRDWWTKGDRARFKARTKALVAQYNAYSPLPGYHVNGELTLGENIADISGLAIAYKAYRISLAGGEAPTIDGLTGDQRFFVGYALSWEDKSRDAEIIRRIKVDPHAPEKFRCNGALINQSAFSDAFGVTPRDKMYLPPEKRVVIW